MQFLGFCFSIQSLSQCYDFTNIRLSYYSLLLSHIANQSYISEVKSIQTNFWLYVRISTLKNGEESLQQH